MSAISAPPADGWAPSPRKRVEPNAHPYAIRTASSALLSRSTSSASPSHARHFYVPSPRPAHRSARSLDLDAGAAEELTSEGSPRPLPPPPSVNGEQESTPPARRRVPRRSDTAPPLALALDADLPPDPKTWTPAQLSAYLLTALRVPAAPLAPAVAREVAAFVSGAGVSGRAFLRLTEADLDALGASTLWRTALLTASRSLRQSVLRGRLWGFNSNSPDDGSPEPESPSSDISVSSGLGTAFSLDSLARLETGHLRRARSGRVRAMAHTIDVRSGSESDASEPGSPVISRRGASDDAPLSRRTPSDDPPPRYSPFKAPRALPLPPQSTGGSERSIAELLAEPEPEPSVEDLLGAQDGGAWGARAWELDGVGETVKHVPAAAHQKSVSRGFGTKGEGRDARGLASALFAKAEFVEEGMPAAHFEEDGQSTLFHEDGQSTLFNDDGQSTLLNDDGQSTLFNEEEHSALFKKDDDIPDIPDADVDPDATLTSEPALPALDVAPSAPEAALLSSEDVLPVPESATPASQVTVPEPAPVAPAPEPASLALEPAAPLAPEPAPLTPEPAADLVPSASEPAPPTPTVAPPAPAPAPPATDDVPDDASAHIAALSAELSTTRSALAAMRARLAALEARMDGLEHADAERGAVLAAALEGIRAREAELLAAKDDAAREKARALARATRHADEAAAAAGGVRLPAALGELPQYVLLVGLGVCAVALQVVLGRVGQRRLR